MERINSLSTRVFSPEREIGRYLQRFDEIETRLNHSMQRILRNRKHHKVEVRLHDGAITCLVEEVSS